MSVLYTADGSRKYFLQYKYFAVDFQQLINIQYPVQIFSLGNKYSKPQNIWLKLQNSQLK